MLEEVDDALLVLLSDYAPGDRITYSQVAQVDRLGLNVSRTAEVLQRLGVLDNDRTPSFDAWLGRLLDQLASGIAADVHAWATLLRDGGPRSTPAPSRPSATTCAPSSPWLSRRGSRTPRRSQNRT